MVPYWNGVVLKGNNFAVVAHAEKLNVEACVF